MGTRATIGTEGPGLLRICNASDVWMIMRNAPSGPGESHTHMLARGGDGVNISLNSWTLKLQDTFEKGNSVFFQHLGGS